MTPTETEGPCTHLRAIESLKQATADPDEYAREAAREALTTIEKACQPWWKFW